MSILSGQCPSRRDRRLAGHLFPLAAPARVLAAAPWHRRRLHPVADSAGEFAIAMRGLMAAGFAGANVTIPHKLAAFEICDFGG